MTAWIRDLSARQVASTDSINPSSLPTPPVMEPLPRTRIIAALALVDFVTIVAAFWGAHFLRDSAQALGHAARVATASMVIAALGLAVYGMNGLYDPRNVARGGRQAAPLFGSWMMLMGLAILGIFLAKADSPLRSRLALFLFFLLGTTLTAAVRRAVGGPGSPPATDGGSGGPG